MKYHLYPIQKTSAKAAARSVLHASAINYPADLVYSGGPVVKTAVSHNIYINCSSSCYGGPQVFIDSINNSSFIHIVDQYTGSTANHRYAAGSNLAVNEPLYDNYLSQGDLFAMIHSAALRFGHGYTNIYHVFLPSGADTCFDLSTTCYSPDNVSTWVFCAYHGSIDFPDSTGHVLFTILPYQNVPGCQQTGGPNSSLVDSTASTMSHEYIETI
ncbi:MAG TPA: hypothetical protein VGN11_00395, partial [Candidatus Baltobacteraceae bacterium]|nr:hypothetical protein [Candidatus Baltobacteraceae bacterium]